MSSIEIKFDLLRRVKTVCKDSRQILITEYHIFGEAVLYFEKAIRLSRDITLLAAIQEIVDHASHFPR